MKSTKPGGREYQLDAAARYVFLVNGAKLEGYRSIIGAGTANIFNMHYYRNSDELKDGDLVLMDYAPDYGNYVSDIARMWPVNGKVRAVAARVAPVRARISERGHQTHSSRSDAARDSRRSEDRDGASVREDEILQTDLREAARNLVERGGGVFRIRSGWPFTTMATTLSGR
jgi:Xaa-Pro aminopeptidase